MGSVVRSVRILMSTAVGVASLSVLAMAAPAEAPPSSVENPDASPPPELDAGASVVPVVDAGPPPPSDVGFALGLRVGYSAPFGRAKDVLFSDVVSGIVPIGVDVGYFPNRNLYFGGYVVYGFASASTSSAACSALETSCGATQFRFGATARVHFLPEQRVDPWAGLALGYDVMNLTATNASTGELVASASDHGFELTLQAGADYKPLSYFGVGPFAELSLGHFAGSSSGATLFGLATFGVRLRTGL